MRIIWKILRPSIIIDYRNYNHIPERIIIKTRLNCAIRQHKSHMYWSEDEVYLVKTLNEIEVPAVIFNWINQIYELNLSDTNCSIGKVR